MSNKEIKKSKNTRDKGFCSCFNETITLTPIKS